MTVCEKCSHRSGFLPEITTLSALEPQGAGKWQALAGPDGPSRFCANAEFEVCNWLIDATSSDNLCLACRHNKTIPDVSVSSNLHAWQKIEAAKHRLFYSLIILKLPFNNREGCAAPRSNLPISGVARAGTRTEGSNGAR